MQAADTAVVTLPEFRETGTNLSGGGVKVTADFQRVGTTHHPVDAGRTG